MRSDLNHSLTVLAVPNGPDSVPSLEVWRARAALSGAMVVVDDSDRCVLSYPLPRRNQQHRALAVVLSIWAPLLETAEVHGLSCIGVLTSSAVPPARAASWARAGLPGELLWEREVLAELTGSARMDWGYGDALTLELEGEEVQLIASPAVGALGEPEATAAAVVGRRRERQQILEALQGVCDRATAGSLLVLEGEAGMGKSTLADAACREAEALGFREVRTRCVDYAQVRRDEPIGRWVMSMAGVTPADATSASLRTAVHSVCANLHRPDIAPLLLDVLDVPLEDEERAVLSRFTSTQVQERRADALAAWVRTVSIEQPLLILVEDLHWASEEVFGLLSKLAEPDTLRRVVLMVTTRPSPISERRHSDLLQAATTIRLGALAPQEARALAMGLSQHHRQPWQVGSAEFLDDATIERCLVRAGGNPLHLAQLLSEGPTPRGPAQTDGSLDDLFSHRVRRLDPTARSLIEIAACIGFYFDGQRPMALAGAGLPDLDRLVSSGLVLRSDVGLRFAHALIRDAVLEEMPAAQRQAVQLALAETESDPMLRAERWAEADDARAFSSFMEVADQRRSAYQWFPALAALERAGAVAARPDEQARALLAQGEIYADQGEGRRSQRCFTQALGALESLPERKHQPLRMRASLGQLAAQRLLGQLDEAETSIKTLRRTLDSPNARASDPLQCAQLDTLRGAIAFSRGRLDLCRRAHASAMLTLENATPPLTRTQLYAQALSGMGDALYAQGAFQEAQDAMQRCVDLAREQALGRIEVSTLHMLGIATAYVGEPDRGQQLARRCWEQACQVGDARAMLFSELNVALTSLWAGHAQQALEACAGSIERAEWLSSSVLMGMTRAFTGHIKLAAGDRTAAIRDRTVALEHVQQGGERLFGGVSYGLALALAARDPERATSDRADAWLHNGLALLGSSVTSHNYIYFALGVVPLAVVRQDPEPLWALLAVLRDFFGAEVQRCPEGVVAALVAWATLELSRLDPSCDVDIAPLRARLAAQPFLRQVASPTEGS